MSLASADRLGDLGCMMENLLQGTQARADCNIRLERPGSCLDGGYPASTAPRRLEEPALSPPRPDPHPVGC
jgi:hypothetical protein